MKQTRKLEEIQNGKIFGIGDYEFIKFADENGITVAVSKDVLFDSRFGSSNNLAKSTVLERIKKRFFRQSKTSSVRKMCLSLKRIFFRSTDRRSMVY